MMMLHFKKLGKGKKNIWMSTAKIGEPLGSIGSGYTTGYCGFIPGKITDIGLGLRVWDCPDGGSLLG